MKLGKGSQTERPTSDTQTCPWPLDPSPPPPGGGGCFATEQWPAPYHPMPTLHLNLIKRPHQLQLVRLPLRALHFAEHGLVQHLALGSAGPHIPIGVQAVPSCTPLGPRALCTALGETALVLLAFRLFFIAAAAAPRVKRTQNSTVTAHAEGGETEVVRNAQCRHHHNEGAKPGSLPRAYATVCFRCVLYQGPFLQPV